MQRKREVPRYTSVLINPPLHPPHPHFYPPQHAPFNPPLHCTLTFSIHSALSTFAIPTQIHSKWSTVNNECIKIANGLQFVAPTNLAPGDASRTYYHTLSRTYTVLCISQY